jgi:hypothetical protein
MSEADMPHFIGVGLAVIVAAGAALSGLDRERGFYPTALVVISSYWDLFAVIGGSAPVIGMETAVMLLFVGAALVGLKVSQWAVVAALVLHGLFDLSHARLIADDGAPGWWSSFCLAYDLTAAGCLAWRLRRGVHNGSGELAM